MAVTPQQHTADFLSASGYEAETIISFLESAADAGKLEAEGRIRIGDTIYDWADSVGRPALYEFDKIVKDEEEPRAKTWRSVNRLAARRHREKFRIVGRPDIARADMGSAADSGDG